MRRITPLLGLALATTMALGAIAVAHDQSTSTKVGVPSRTATGLSGKVTSGKAACQKNRSVRVEYQSIGAHFEVGRTKTNSSGRWTMKFDPPSSTYEIVVRTGTKVLLKNSAHKHTCEGDANGKVFGH